LQLACLETPGNALTSLQPLHTCGLSRLTHPGLSSCCVLPSLDGLGTLPALMLLPSLGAHRHAGCLAPVWLSQLMSASGWTGRACTVHVQGDLSPRLSRNRARQGRAKRSFTSGVSSACCDHACCAGARAVPISSGYLRASAIPCAQQSRLPTNCTHAPGQTSAELARPDFPRTHLSCSSCEVWVVGRAYLCCKSKGQSAAHEPRGTCSGGRKRSGALSGGVAHRLSTSSPCSQQSRQHAAQI